MRTRITSGWLVAHAAGHHTLWRNAELVYEGNAVLFVGEGFEGIGMMVEAMVMGR